MFEYLSSSLDRVVPRLLILCRELFKFEQEDEVEAGSSGSFSRAVFVRHRLSCLSLKYPLELECARGFNCLSVVEVVLRNRPNLGLEVTVEVLVLGLYWRGSID
uniref:Uncharacterized protein n=1 Tax=Cacopsylla melanoneura TaxID=428564 RepID=A0A8D8LQL4_9HEMI